MTKPLQLLNRSRWLATWLQARRRARAARQQAPSAPPANAPEIIFGDSLAEGTTPGWWDVFIDFTFDHGANPVAELEVWLSFNGGALTLLATIPSTDTTYAQANATDSLAQTFDFKLRYRNEAYAGPFSEVYQVITH